MKKIYFLTFVCFLITIFDGYTMNLYKEIPVPEGYEERKELQFEIIEKINNKLEEKYEMISCAIGSSGDGCLLKSIDVSFERCKGPISFEENRRILLDCIQIYLDEFNNNEKIKKYLFKYPFTEENIEMGIHNCEKDGTTVFHPHIGTLFNSPNGISYYTYDRMHEDTCKYQQIIKETYEEAYSKLNQAKESQSKSVRN